MKSIEAFDRRDLEFRRIIAEPQDGDPSHAGKVYDFDGELSFPADGADEVRKDKGRAFKFGNADK
ncbi:hypothetical protein H5T56_01030 [Candidatus Bipolaricaulota bacterium]|nr:hypothetical protein [Candidatus Bipolaricaulota bacterium]